LSIGLVEEAVDKGSGKLAVIALASIVEKQRLIAVTACKKLITKYRSMSIIKTLLHERQAFVDLFYSVDQT